MNRMFEVRLLPFQILIVVFLFPFISCKEKDSEIKEIAIEESTDSSTLNIPPKDYQMLFNGTDFDGWHVVNQHEAPDGDLFSVKEGMIHGYPTQKENSEQPFGALITDEEYENYTLSLEYKWGEKKFAPRNEDVRDAGIGFHVFDEHLFWASCAECQIQEGDTGDLWLIGVRGSTKVEMSNFHYSAEGEILTKGSEEDSKRYQSFPRSFYWEKSGWNKIIVEVKGSNAKFTINGKVVNEALNLERYDKKNKKWIPLTKGKILLQAEGAEVFYRNIFIKKTN